MVETAWLHDGRLCTFQNFSDIIVSDESKKLSDGHADLSDAVWKLWVLNFVKPNTHADADETKLFCRVASAVCIGLKELLHIGTLFLNVSLPY